MKLSDEKKIDEKGLDVEFICDEDRMFVLADQDAIHQILYNICDNAVKFASERGQLKMSFTWSNAEGNRKRKAVVKVYNEGQGIPAEDLPFIFDIEDLHILDNRTTEAEDDEEEEKEKDEDID